jgi:hypothetical protein
MSVVFLQSIERTVIEVGISSRETRLHIPFDLRVNHDKLQSHVEDQHNTGIWSFIERVGQFVVIMNDGEYELRALKDLVKVEQSGMDPSAQPTNIFLRAVSSGTGCL